MIFLSAPDLGSAAVLFLLMTSFVGGVMSAAFGIGGGLIMLAVLGSFLPPAALIPIHGIVQVGSNFGRSMVMFRTIKWSLVPPFFVGAIIGASVGGMTVVNLPPAMVQLGVGLFIFWSIFATPPRAFHRSTWFIGLVSSFLTMFFGASGPFVIAYVKSLSLGRMEQVGTHATFMTIQHVLKTLIFGFLGFSFGPWLGLITGLIITGLIGTVVGRSILVRTTENRFSKWLNVILFLLALRLTYSGIRAIIGI